MRRLYIALEFGRKARYNIVMKLHGNREKREKLLENHLFEKRYLQIRIPRSPDKKLRIKFTEKQVVPRDLAKFTTKKTLFGPQVLGTPAYPKKFDLVARPTFPRHAEVIVVELKAGKLGYQDLRQLLGYITFVRYIQTYGGSVGLRHLSEAIGFHVTKRTRISGILIGRQVSGKLMDWIPEELWHLVRICTFRVSSAQCGCGSVCMSCPENSSAKCNQRKYWC